MQTVPWNAVLAVLARKVVDCIGQRGTYNVSVSFVIKLHYARFSFVIGQADAVAVEVEFKKFV